MLDILFRDEHLMAINKPHDLLVHRSSIAADAEEFALQMLRDQVGQKVYPVHRIDRKTAGVLLFAFEKSVEIEMQKQFADNLVSKKYLAIVRGHTPDDGRYRLSVKKRKRHFAGSFYSLSHFKTCRTGGAVWQIIPHQDIHWWKLLPQPGECTSYANILPIFFIPLLATGPMAAISKINYLKKNGR